MRHILFAVAALLPLSGFASAEEAKGTTTITVEGMHCAGCAKSLTTKLGALKDVQKADIDLKSGKATVTSKPTGKVSPKSLWETVVAAGYTPTKLVGPEGTFTKKPEA